MMASVRRALGVRVKKVRKGKAVAPRAVSLKGSAEETPSTSSSDTRITSATLQTALTHLGNADPVLGRMIRTLGPPKTLVRRLEAPGSAFTSLVRSIVGQQLSTKAASSIYSRLVELVGPEATPATILDCDPQDLRAIGLSGRKVEYVKDLARHFDSGAVSDEALGKMSEGDVMKSLIAVRGLGEWSVHMFQIFHLGMADVLPVGDLGVKKGAAALYTKSKKAVTKEDLEEIGSKWAPHRSLGSWYMWRAQEFLDKEKT